MRRALNRCPKFFIGMALLFLVLFVGWFFSAGDHTPSPLMTPALLKASAPPSDPALLHSWHLTERGAKTALELDLSKLPHYHFESNPPAHALILDLANTTVLHALPGLKEVGHAIHSIKLFKRHDHTLQLAIGLQKDEVLDGLVAKDGKHPRLFLNLSKKQASVHRPTVVGTPELLKKPAQTAFIVKRAHAVSERDQLQAEYAYAQRLLSQKQYVAAQKPLEQVLRRRPGFVDARLVLAKLLIQDRQLKRAMSLLQEGIALNSAPEFVQILAEVHMERQQPHRALTLLNAYAPEMSRYPHYYALKALLYLRQGRLENAAALYQQVLAYHPEDGRLWVGLATALAHLERNNQAIEAYAHAQQAGSLTPGLRLFIAQQIKALS